MKQYLTFTAEDFACDEDFLKWVKYPGRYPLLDKFWQNWLFENDHKKEVIDEARHIILAVIQETQFLPNDAREREVWNRIEDSIGLMPAAGKQVSFWQQWYSKAAVILVITGAGWLAWHAKGDNTPMPIPVPEAVASAHYVKQINNADAPKTVILGDGTSIILQPHSVLEYPETFSADTREVFLTGQAFFEVSRDASRPFLVHANEIVTRVLGTSFMVRNYAVEKNVLVQVKTGKVSVFREKEKRKPSVSENKTVDGVVLMPNQQVLYEREQMKMTKSLVENPSVLIPIAKQEFEFVDTPIKVVFVAIEEAYGVDIVFDEEILSTCYLNASLSDVPLYEKLKLICKGTNTTYEIIDSHIIIYGRGCSTE